MERSQTTLHVSLIAKEFHSGIREALGTDELVSIDEGNAICGPDTCVTHDYLDANVYMHVAFEKVMDRDPDCGSEDDATLWNMAWGLARCNGFNKDWDDRPRAG